MLAATHQQSWRLPFNNTLATLKEFAQAIYRRIEALDDARSCLARQRWQERSALQPEKCLAIATGFELEAIHEIWPTAVTGAANEPEIFAELSAAARMLNNRLDLLQIKNLLLKIQTLERGAITPQFMKLRELAEIVLAQNDEPYQQGYILASEIRNALEILAESAIDPEEQLLAWGIKVHEINLSDVPIDAVAVWGHGAAILLNSAGPRASSPSGVRSTLAHEICHLLVDYRDALPVAEVLGGRVPKALEQRANAFAAEYLLPRLAARKMRESEEDIKQVLDKLAKHYGISHESAAWQLINSGVSNADKQALQSYLNSVYMPFDFSFDDSSP
jgi:Zn-dependent peptidase ImmA (M78 family)